jgi:hypothetical protein
VDTVTDSAAKAADTAKAAVMPDAPPAAPPVPKTIEQIEGELDEVRARLAGRINDLESYVSPKNIVARQVEAAKRVFVDEYGGIKPDRVLMAVGAVVVLVGLSSIRRRRRRG